MNPVWIGFLIGLLIVVACVVWIGATVFAEAVNRIDQL